MCPLLFHRVLVFTERNYHREEETVLQIDQFDVPGLMLGGMYDDVLSWKVVNFP